MKSPVNLTSKSVSNLTERGYVCETVEKWKRFPDRNKRECGSCGHRPLISVRSDLFGFADILAIHPEDAKVVLVQTTTRPNHSARRNKILSSMEAKLVLLAGVQILIQSWRQKAVGERWQLFEEWITLDQFKQAPHYPSNVRDLIEIRRKENAPDLPAGSAFQFAPIKDSELPF
jgi:hypothetical protein